MRGIAVIENDSKREGFEVIVDGLDASWQDTASRCLGSVCNCVSFEYSVVWQQVDTNP